VSDCNTLCVAVCCSVLQCVAEQVVAACVAVCRSVLQSDTDLRVYKFPSIEVLQCMYCSVLQCIAVSSVCCSDKIPVILSKESYILSKGSCI